MENLWNGNEMEPDTMCGKCNMESCNRVVLNMLCCGRSYCSFFTWRWRKFSYRLIVFFFFFFQFQFSSMFKFLNIWILSSSTWNRHKILDFTSICFFYFISFFLILNFWKRWTIQLVHIWNYCVSGLSDNYSFEYVLLPNCAW